MSRLYLQVDPFFSLHVYGVPLGPEYTTNIYIYIEREEVTVDSLRKLASLVIMYHY